jgi:hypothetical protein
MTSVQRLLAVAVVLVGLAGAAVLWWTSGPPLARVQRTVITTVQEEAQASFYVTGTLEMGATVSVDSSAYLTPDWLTVVLRNTNPAMVPLTRGSTTATVRIPGRVSYGFRVQNLTPEMIDVSEDGTIGVTIPALEIHSVEPDLTQLEVRTASEGWMRLFGSDTHTDVRDKALAGVEGAFRAQARRHLDTATQPRTNTARALQTLLRAPIEAAGIPDPQFRIRIGDDLVLSGGQGP